MFRKTQHLGLRIGHGALAVSDGELNMMDAEGRGSSHSLDSNSQQPDPQHSRGIVGKVASWAVSFERLLEDPTGVRYFTAFLKSEVSEENILFWQACEKFRKIQADHTEELIREARSIYDSYLARRAVHAINIDDTARVNESELQTPRSDMFNKAQLQIFKLMKFDSYTRFIRSQLYQNCMLADVEGRPLPGSKNQGPKKIEDPESPSISDGKKKKRMKPGKSQPVDMEDGAERRRGAHDTRALWDRRGEHRGSWGAEMSDHHMVWRTQSDNSSKSTGSLDAESERSALRDPDLGCVPMGRAEKYCCVFLPDGTASLAPTRPGLTIREMLTSLCEKRGFSLRDVTIYMQGKDKQPLMLDQDSSVLREQQVFLEVRVTFVVEIGFTGKSVGIVAKSGKTLQEALLTLLQKHCLRAQDAVLTESGKTEPLKMDMLVSSLANKTLHLDRAKGKDQSSGVQASNPQRRAAITIENTEDLELLASRVRPNVRSRNTGGRRNYDMDGVIDMLSRSQWLDVDDQRGLLRKEHLVMPSFLELPPVEVKEEEGKEKVKAEVKGSQEPCPDPSAPTPTPGKTTQAEPERAEGVSETKSRSPRSRPEGSFFCSDYSRETVV
ncbi:hypothetical protein JZ751_006286 [Albula glossodonta]|uniref:Regulator of G-protein signaling 14 n=1 Tax=Albula glossodonta TaxID=121402 RepID=A0A8T2MLK6_9TELE|nr:hypothetical protein JZ751_006286 [Albula glossodonta]